MSAGKEALQPVVLVIEDDRDIQLLLRVELAAEGYKVLEAYDGVNGLAMARECQPSLVVVDLGLPGGVDGLEVVRRLRRRSGVPIVILTARDAVADRVAGLDAGANDYVVKPFSLEEFLARLRVQLRGKGSEGVIRLGQLVVEPIARRVWQDGVEVRLSGKEFDLLELFVRHPNRIFSRLDIQERVWGLEEERASNVVEVYISYLRAKLGSAGGQLIRTVRGVGYALKI